MVTIASELLKRVSEDQMLREKTGDSLTISILSLNSQKLEVRDATVMWFQLFIDVLIHMNHKSVDRQEIIRHCRQMSPSNEQDLADIDEFEKEYTSEKAIWWYSRDTCFYRMMNKALRMHEFDTVFIFRVFIADIAKRIRLEYENFFRKNGDRNTIRVYRGQAISVPELELMKNNIDGFLSMNSFVSTSRDKKIALNFVPSRSERDQTLPILFEIEINPKLRTKAFADIHKISEHHGEYETLIMLGALFCIKKVFEDSHKKMWIAQLTLASEDDFRLKELFSHMKEKIGDETDLDTLGRLLLRMDENERARRCYRRLMEETQLKLSDAQMGFAWASLRCHDTDEGIKNFEASLEIRQRLLGDDHPRVAEIYSFLGEAYRKAGNYDQALFYLTKAAQIEERFSPEHSSNLAVTYETMGSVYTNVKQYVLALSHYEKVLSIRQRIFPVNHPQIASAYVNFARLFDEQDKNAEAMQHYQKALDIAKETLPPTHRLVTQTKDQLRQLKVKMESNSSFA